MIRDCGGRGRVTTVVFDIDVVRCRRRAAFVQVVSELAAVRRNSLRIVDRIPGYNYAVGIAGIRFNIERRQRARRHRRAVANRLIRSRGSVHDIVNYLEIRTAGTKTADKLYPARVRDFVKDVGLAGNTSAHGRGDVRLSVDIDPDTNADRRARILRALRPNGVALNLDRHPAASGCLGRSEVHRVAVLVIDIGVVQNINSRVPSPVLGEVHCDIVAREMTGLNGQVALHRTTVRVELEPGRENVCERASGHRRRTDVRSTKKIDQNAVIRGRGVRHVTDRCARHVEGRHVRVGIDQLDAVVRRLIDHRVRDGHSTARICELNAAIVRCAIHRADRVHVGDDAVVQRETIDAGGIDAVGGTVLDLHPRQAHVGRIADKDAASAGTLDRTAIARLSGEGTGTAAAGDSEAAAGIRKLDSVRRGACRRDIGQRDSKRGSAAGARDLDCGRATGSDCAARSGDGLGVISGQQPALSRIGRDGEGAEGDCAGVRGKADTGTAGLSGAGVREIQGSG